MPDSPFCHLRLHFPPAGGNLSSQGGAFLHLTVSTKAFPQEIILLNFGIAERLWAFRYPFFTAGMQRETAVEQPASRPLSFCFCLFVSKSVRNAQDGCFSSVVPVYWIRFPILTPALDFTQEFDTFFDKEEPSAAAFGCAPNTNHIMEQMLICLSLALIAGLLMSRAAKAVRLPAVTAYLLTGLLLGPFFLGRLGLSRFGFGFGSLAAVEGYGILTQVALGFIAFVIGNEFRLSALKHMGRRAVTVGVAQAVITTALVDIALVALHFARPDVISLASAITLGSIAAATAPAATLMVVKQYKADGPLTKLLLMVVAIDDAVGLVLFSASYGVANALEQGRIDPMSVVLEPLLEIALSLALGAAAGYLLNLLEVYFHSRSKRMSLSVAFVLLTVGLSMTQFEINGTRCGFSLLLVCMMTGTVFCNVCPTSDELMDRLDRWVSPINILFFVLSGAELDLTILTNPMVLLIGVVYIVARSAGKISGSYLSCRATSCSPAIQKYLGITLLPQAGVALGMAATAAELSDGHMVRNVVLFSVLVYELVGPTLTKLSLTAAGEIRPEGRTSARVENQPEAPVELS